MNGWVRHVARMWEKEYAGRALVGKKMERHHLQDCKCFGIMQ